MSKRNERPFESIRKPAADNTTAAAADDTGTTTPEAENTSDADDTTTLTIDDRADRLTRRLPPSP